jgi:glycerol uptake facilitator-like aquaporin
MSIFDIVVAVVLVFLVLYVWYLKRRINAIQAAIVIAFTTMGSLVAMGEATGNVMTTMNEANVAHAELHRQMQAILDSMSEDVAAISPRKLN